MTPEQARVVQAEADARAARVRLTGTIAAIQERVNPTTLVRQARRELVEVKRTAERSARLVVADDSRRLALGGGVAGLFILGVPLLRWRRRRRIAKRAARIRGD